MCSLAPLATPAPLTIATKLAQQEGESVKPVLERLVEHEVWCSILSFLPVRELPRLVSVHTSLRDSLKTFSLDLTQPEFTQLTAHQAHLASKHFVVSGITLNSVCRDSTSIANIICRGFGEDIPEENDSDSDSDDEDDSDASHSESEEKEEEKEVKTETAESNPLLADPVTDAEGDNVLMNIKKVVAGSTVNSVGELLDTGYLIDLSFATRCFNLLEVTLQNCRNAGGDIAVFQNCPNLRKADLAFTSAHGDVAVFQRCPELRTLFLWDTDCHGDVGVFKNCIKLEELMLRGTGVHGDLAVFEVLSNMKLVSLFGTRVLGDISCFRNMRQCTTFCLERTDLTGDVDIFTKLPAVARMGLAGTQVSGDVASFSKIPAIEYLSLAQTNVHGDVISFSNLINAQMINLRNTALTGDRAALQEALPACSIYA